jgi:hypothetical protein
VAIGAISGGTGGYISGGWKGAVIGAAVGGVGGRFFPGWSLAVAEQIGGTTGMVAGAGTFVALNGAAGGVGSMATNYVLGQRLFEGTLYATGAGMFAPIASGEAFVVGLGGEAEVGLEVANAFSAYTGLISVGATAVDPTTPPAAPPSNQGH